MQIITSKTRPEELPRTLDALYTLGEVGDLDDSEIRGLQDFSP